MLNPEPSAIIVVTGIQASGKSTVSRLLAQRFARGVHVEADALQRMIVSGGEGVTEPRPPTGEAAAQLRLRLKNMCLLGRSFAGAGFTAVLDDIILGERWDQLCEDLAGAPFSVVVLAPSVAAVCRRDANRAKAPLGEEWARYLDRELRATMRGSGLWVDSSGQTPGETVNQIMDRLTDPCL